MNLLVLGSGGREHALVEAILESRDEHRVFVAPGNAGTLEHNVELDLDDHEDIVGFCESSAVDLVVVGPEAPLVAGLADDLLACGIACFGPSAAAARLEGSKAFTREFAGRHGIPGPRSATFTDVEQAVAWLDEIGKPVVVKADGLAAGKGVVIPEDRVETERAIFEMLSGQSMGEAGTVIVLEERMEGEELSLIGFCDGTTVKALPPAQDHKRVGEGDTGPNTGGMGAFAPVPGVTPVQVSEYTNSFLQRAVDGMRAEGTPYVGLLYAGLMLTADGPRLIEYNCRLGDPEAQVLLSLLETDLVELMVACVDGRLDDVELVVSGGTAATVVVAADGYPAAPRRGVVIPSVRLGRARLLHAGTTIDQQGRLVSTGGRVLSVVGCGSDLPAALDDAYAVVDQLTDREPDLFARRDIGWRHLPRSAYAEAGVSLSAGAATTVRIADAVKSTHDDRVVAGLGSFGGVFDVSGFAALDQPLLVATTDGVGTKTVLAERLDRWEGCGADIVNHGVNDVLVQGAKPLFFLDTVASATLDPEVVGRIVDGMAEACRNNGCVLLGGETAEMPDVLTAGSVDIAGTLVGVVERPKLLPRPGIAPGHLLVGLASSGLHTNGYSLARKVVAELDLASPLPNGGGDSIGDALLAVHRSYLAPLSRALELDLVDALAHITGGGLIDNIPRILPDGCGAEIDPSSWEMPPLFKFVVSRAGLNQFDALNILNCGIGMVVVVAPERLDELGEAIAEQTWVIGQVTAGAGVKLPVTARLVVLLSGNGSNLQALIDASSDGTLDARVVAVVADAADAHGLVRAETAGIATEVVLRQGDDRPTYDRRLADVVAAHRPDLVVLAGWMRILTAQFVDRYEVVNLHPALPGTFPGLHAIERAFDSWQAGEIAESGVMVHRVPDEGVDDGPVIGTAVVPFEKGDTLESYEARVHRAEHRLLVESVANVINQPAGTSTVS